MSFHKNIFQNKLKQAEQKLGFDFNESLEDNIPIDDSNNDNNNNTILNWSDGFDNNDIYCDSNGYCFQTYYKKPSFNNHLISNDSINLDNEMSIIFIAHHGAGSSGLTFTELCKKITENSSNLNYLKNPGFLTFDMRGHGNTNLINRSNKNLNNLNYNLSIDDLIIDFKFILDYFIEKNLNSNSNYLFYFIGHSLGGSVLTKFLNLNYSNYPFIKSLILLDIVESTTIKSLNLMDNYLNNLPSNFNSYNDAINWFINNNLIFNKLSCDYSIPAILTKNLKSNKLEFITNLKLTKNFWYNWFINLSLEFISLPTSISKLLILANDDYLDKNLIIGQMQGKFQLIIFKSNNLINNNENNLTTLTKNINSDSNKISHFIHEDIPDKLSITLLEFIERNDYNNFHKDQINPQLDLINKLNEKWHVKK